MRPRPDAMRLRSRTRPERVRPKLRPRPNDLASRPHGPRGLNIPALTGQTDYNYKETDPVFSRKEFLYCQAKKAE